MGINALQSLKTKLLLGCLLGCLIFSQVGMASATGPASLSFAPATASVDAEKNLVIKVHLNSGGQAVNVVQADISYPLNIFDPAKSKAVCSNPFPTAAEQTVKNTINDNGTQKGLIKLACAVAVGDKTGAPPFIGDADIATMTLYVKQDALPTHDAEMLKFVTDSKNTYSAVARASDSSNILGSTQPADVTINSKVQAYESGDINNDKVVDAKDLSIVVSNFGLPAAKASNAKADLNGDRIINAIDFSILLSKQ